MLVLFQLLSSFPFCLRDIFYAPKEKNATYFNSSMDPVVQRSLFAVGMICCEEEGRLKEKPILLQSR